MREEDFEGREISDEEREALTLIMVKRNNVLTYMAFMMIIIALVNHAIPENYFEEPITPTTTDTTATDSSGINAFWDSTGTESLIDTTALPADTLVP